MTAYDCATSSTPRRSVFALGKGVGCRLEEGEGGGSATQQRAQVRLDDTTHYG